MATLIFEDMIGGHHLKAQDLVTPRAQEYARKTRFKHKQGHVLKIAWSIEDLRTHGFGQHLMGHDLVIFIKGAITMKPVAASAILVKLEAITRQWEVINERLDHMGVPREQVGYPNTRQDEDRSSCELRGKNVIPYTHMNVVAVLPSVGVHESSFCDTLDIFRSHEDQTLVVGTQALVDPLDDEIDSPRENDLCPSGASTYNLTKVPLPSDESIHTLVDPCEKQGESTLVCELPTTSEGEQNDQPGVDDLDLLEYLKNPSFDCLCEDDFDCGPLASRDVHDIFNSDKEGLLNFEDDTLRESKSGRDLSPWLRLPFDPGSDLRLNPFQEGKDDTIQMATLIFENMIGGHHLKAQDLVIPRVQEYARKTRFKHKQGRVWKISWSIEDLRTHSFGQNLMGHDLVIFIKDVDNDMDIFEMMCSLEDGDEVEVFVNHLVDDPNVMAPPSPKPLFLENICHGDLKESGASFNVRPNFRVGEDHLNVEDPASSFFSTTSPFNTIPLFTTVLSVAASSAAAPRVAASRAVAPKEEVEGSDYSTDDSIESKGELVGDDDEEEYGSDVHEEVMKLRAEKRKFQRRKRRERVPTDNAEVPVGEAGPDLGSNETETGRVSHKGRLGGDEPYIASSDKDSFILDEDDCCGDDEHEVVDSGRSRTVKLSKKRTTNQKIIHDPTAKKFV
ncbi:hypothetical protein BC332_09100 [Capsicum chinense]|nr:hypothetical protein BC332_09100 [Capsicum chinense]